MKKYIIGFTIGLLIALPVSAFYLGLFNDVPEGEWFADKVEFLASKGIVRGYDDDTFRPGNNVTRAEVSAFVARSMAEMGHSGAACVVDPYEQGGIGGLAYPVSTKNSHLKELGPIFTAANCGTERLNKLFAGSNYLDHGVSLVLKEAPPLKLQQALSAADFECDEFVQVQEPFSMAPVPPSVCKKWKVDKITKLSAIQSLAEYASSFEHDDCIDCG